MTARPLPHEQQVNTPPESMNPQARGRIRIGHSAARHGGAQWSMPPGRLAAAFSGSAQAEEVAPAMIATTKRAM